jgi:hypothetical protein
MIYTHPQLHEWLELLYFSSGIIVAVAALIGLRQLFLAKSLLTATEQQVRLANEALSQAKTDLETRSRRESVVLAAERCADFANIVMRGLKQLETAIDAGVQVTRWKLKDADFNWKSLEDEKQGKAWAAEVLKTPSAHNEIAACANDLEGFAIYFATGAADEELACPVAGPVFCERVEYLAAHIISAREGTAGLTSGPYQNTIRLYNLWSERLKAQQLTKDLTRTKQQLGALKPDRIRPIGTR